jgi:hypothetical protein
MGAMSTRPAPPAPGGAFTRRALLLAAGVVPALGLVAVCTSDPPGADAVTPAQVDRLAGQVAVQEQLVAAGASAFAASPELAAAAAPLAEQWQQQLDRLRRAAPSATSSASASGSATATSGAGAAPAADPRAQLRTQVATTADAHAAACLEFTGARAALLGSIAAGLRGHDGVLA